MTGEFKGLRASELICWLQQMIAEYGDCRMFSMVDYDEIGLVELYPPDTIFREDEPLFVLSWCAFEPERKSDGSFVLLQWEEE